MELLRLARGRTIQQILKSQPFRQGLQQQQHTSQLSFRSRPINTRTYSRYYHFQRPNSSSFTRTNFKRPLRTGRRHASTETAQPEQNLTLSQRLKKLSREYGWTAVGVYFALSALDFPFCFIAVRMLGTERIGHWEHVIVSNVKSVLKWPLPEAAKQQIEGPAEMVEGAVRSTINEIEQDKERLLDDDSTYAVQDHGVKAAQVANSGDNASLWTQLALAYAIHKSFIFLRVPLTAAVLPKVVKTLRGWGYNIGKMPPKKISTAGSTTGVNTKGTGVK